MSTQLSAIIVYRMVLCRSLYNAAFRLSSCTQNAVPLPSEPVFPNDVEYGSHRKNVDSKHEIIMIYLDIRFVLPKSLSLRNEFIFNDIAT